LALACTARGARGGPGGFKYGGPSGFLAVLGRWGHARQLALRAQTRRAFHPHRPALLSPAQAPPNPPHAPRAPWFSDVSRTHHVGVPTITDDARPVARNLRVREAVGVRRGFGGACAQLRSAGTGGKRSAHV
jgi:hypothetical protein